MVRKATLTRACAFVAMLAYAITHALLKKTSHLNRPLDSILSSLDQIQTQDIKVADQWIPVLPTHFRKEPTNGTPEKHPHSRGEDLFLRQVLRPDRETPPLARGRPFAGSLGEIESRNTPTRAGKTQWEANGKGFGVETPPLARGRPSIVLIMSVCPRNTPTRAGKTNFSPLYMPTCPETPPLARGRLTKIDTRGFIYRKHPHSRGEDQSQSKSKLPCLETPPLARGRQRNRQDNRSCQGNTPTRAGKTFFHFKSSSTFGKHPHSRGEDRKI